MLAPVQINVSKCIGKAALQRLAQESERRGQVGLEDYCEKQLKSYAVGHVFPTKGNVPVTQRSTELVTYRLIQRMT